jgi:hypothetical protein
MGRWVCSVLVSLTCSLSVEVQVEQVALQTAKVVGEEERAAIFRLRTLIYLPDL